MFFYDYLYILAYLVLISLLCIVSISAISASENATNEVISTDNNQDLILDENIREDVSQNSDNKEDNLVEENNEDDLKSSTDNIGTHKYVITSTNPKYKASTTIRVTIPKKTIKSIIIKAIGKGYKTSYKNIRPDSRLLFYREIKQSPSAEKLYVELWHPYVSKQPYKIAKVKYFFKNAYNGKVIKRTITKVYRSGLTYYTALKIPAWYYKPMGAKVWYRPV